MATNARDLLIRLLGDSTGMKKAMSEADDAAGKHDLTLKNLAGTIGSAYAATKVIEFGKASLEAAAADEASQVKLATALRNTAGATDAQIAAAEKWIEQTMFATGVTDDELRPALERLTRATGDVGSAQDLLKVAMDASAGTGKSLQAVTEAMGKASDGNVGALSRLGIATKDAEGKTLSFDEVVQNMASTFSGQAAAAADTQAGKLAIMKARMGELQEQIGAALMPIMEQLVGVLSGVAEWFTSLDESTQTWIIRIGMLGGGLVLATRAVNGVLGPLKQLGIIGKGTDKAIGGVTTALGVVGIAAGAGIAIYSALSAEKDRVRQITDDFVDSLLAEAQGQKGATVAAIAAKLAHSDALEVGEQLNLSAQDIADVISGKTVPAWDTLTQTLHSNELQNMSSDQRLRELQKRFGASGIDVIDFVAEIERLSGAMEIAQVEVAKTDSVNRAFGVTTDGTSTAVEGLGDSAVDATADLDGLQGSTVANVDILGPYKAAVDAATEAVKLETEQTDRQKDAIDRAEDALRDVNQALADRRDLERELYEGQLSQLDTQYAFEEQTRELAESLGEYNSAASVADDDTRAMAKQIRDAAVDYGTLDGAVRGSKEATDRTIESLQGVANTLAPNSPLRAQLNRYIEDLKRVPTTVATLLNLGVQVGYATPADPIGKRAAGGPVTAGRPYIVGEHRPELFVPGQSGTILPFVPGGGATVTQYITVAGPIMGERDWVRRMEEARQSAIARGEILVPAGSV